MVTIWREREPLQDGVWRTDTCGHRHRSLAAAERCKRIRDRENEAILADYQRDREATAGSATPTEENDDD
jgi:hypothetical protein